MSEVFDIAQAKRVLETDPHSLGILEALELGDQVNEAAKAARRRRMQMAAGALCVVAITVAACAVF